MKAGNGLCINKNSRICIAGNNILVMCESKRDKNFFHSLYLYRADVRKINYIKDETFILKLMEEGTFKLENRAYHSDSTPEEIEALKALVYFIAEDIIVKKEPPVSSRFHQDLCYGKLKELSDTVDKKCYCVVDISETEPPSPEIRRILKEKNEQLASEFEHVCLVTGKSKIMNMLLKFILGPIMGEMPHSVYNSIDHAVKGINNMKIKKTG